MQYDTENGRIFAGGPCQDDYDNIVLYHQKAATIKLQRPAMKSFKDCEAKLGFELHCSGTWRSCAYQADLYASDPHRYASPDGTLHTRGLAIDVSQAMSTEKLAEVHRFLMNHDWHQARSDEPWHYSYHLAA